MKKILLIEDDLDLADQIKSYLEKEDHIVDVATCVQEATRHIRSHHDLSLLDIHLPDGNGIHLLELLKSYQQRVIITTIKDDENFIIHALDNGADDYITKPFSLGVLRARIDACLRNSVHSSDKICYKGFVFDKSVGCIFYENDFLDLTPKELELLSLFIRYPHRIFTREYLLKNYWDIRENYVNDNTLTVTIKRIREKIGKDSILTIRGIGYRMGL
ncbi:MAG: response regulator transcription factor [Peptostreptococcaceae bacterium]|nr:response regulator transcription factor [Peptostreptococcaceae bacterium]